MGGRWPFADSMVVPHLSNTGYSMTAWHLLGDPANVTPFGIACWNGVEGGQSVSVREDCRTCGVHPIVRQVYGPFPDFDEPLLSPTFSGDDPL
jgi:hypothetical protein